METLRCNMPEQEDSYATERSGLGSKSNARDRDPESGVPYPPKPPIPQKPKRPPKRKTKDRLKSGKLTKRSRKQQREAQLGDEQRRKDLQTAFGVSLPAERIDYFTLAHQLKNSATTGFANIGACVALRRACRDFDVPDRLRRLLDDWRSGNTFPPSEKDLEVLAEVEQIIRRKNEESSPSQMDQPQ